jgi:hypothetical protein
MKTINKPGKRQIKCTRYLLFCAIVLTATISNLFAQNVLVTDDSNYVAKSSAMLDIKSSNKGLLMPRVALTSTSSALPITSPDSSLMVYNTATAGNVTPGYYYWNGAKWVRMANGQGGLTVVTKTATTTLLQTETMVAASNNITLTLPVITSADDGLEITIKNVGTYTDLVIVSGNSGAKIDNTNTCKLIRWRSETFIASNGNWLLKFHEHHLDNMYNVDYSGPFKSISEVLAFLNLHMNAPSVIQLCGDEFSISATQVINLPYHLTIQGTSIGSTIIKPATGLANSPMFRCMTDCNFKMCDFETSYLAAYGTMPGEDCIRYAGSNTYNEITDCTINGFYNGIVDSTSAEVWLFESNLKMCNKNAVLIQSPLSGTTVKVNAAIFENNRRGFNMASGSSAKIEITNSSFENTNASDTAVIYKPGSFSFTEATIANNVWNSVGQFIIGFDFTRSDGRDANAFLESNAGVGNSSPKCKINVRDNASITTMTTALTYYKAVWTNTSSIPCKFTVANNRITYQSTNGRNATITLTGDISDNWYNTTLSIAVIKNGVTATPYGETNVFIAAGLQPFQFATVIEIDNIAKNDYFEVFCYSNHATDQITFQDVQWYTECK